MTLNEYFSSYYELICRGNLEDLELYYCENSAQMNASKQQYEMLRKQYDFDLALQDIALLAKQEDLLIARDQLCFNADIEGQSIEKVSTNIHTLVKEAGKWKIHCSTPLPEEMA